MQYSARNQLKGKVASIKLAGVMAEVGIELPGGQQIVSAITRESVESLGLKEGDDVVAMIKSTEVIVGKE
ncbi:MAG: TOBE domain-containing protein [Ktedonobacteraceae bacterium]|nr:TOBE domain-containing protein [Ktedonobacteraceae bacterium]MBV9689700.1 TOBE domain-containing protein [Ktedonobacteraceae bacterium]